MEFQDISILIKLFIGAVATFFAILLWSKTAETSWVLVAIGTIIYYIEIVFSTLNNFGIFEEFQISGIYGFDVINSILMNLPILLYTIAFLIVIIRKRS